MHDRIYKTKGPLDPERDEAILIERHELWQIVRLATQPSVHSYGAIQSARQTGKTTLLYQARSVLSEKECGVAFVDLSPLEDQTDLQACYQFICQQILDDLSGHLRLQRPARQRLEEVTGPISFRAFLEEVARRARPSRLVILLDEVKAVPDEMSSAFFGTIRSIFTSRRKDHEKIFEKFVFILAGATELHELTQGENSPLNICEKIYLQDLDADDVWKLVSNLEKAGCQVSRQVSDYIYQQTKGHPYLTQRICALLELHRVPRLTRAAVDEACAEIIRGDDNLEHVTRQLDRDAEARRLTREIMATDQEVAFSRVNPTISRLEMIGVIKPDTTCQIRNPLYEQALRHYLQLLPSKRRRRAKWRRRILLSLAGLLFIVSTPILVLYIAENWLSDHYVNQRIVLPALQVQGYVRHDTLFRLGKEERIEIEIQRPEKQNWQPVQITLEPLEEDITSVQGEYQLAFTQAHESKYIDVRLQRNVKLQDLAFPYLTQRGRHINLYMAPYPEPETGSRSSLAQTANAAAESRVPFYTVTAKTDYVSSVIGSLIVWLLSVAAGIGGTLSHLDTLSKWGPHLFSVLKSGKGREQER